MLLLCARKEVLVMLRQLGRLATLLKDEKFIA